MKQHCLKEDKLPPKLIVYFTSNIKSKIEHIAQYNQKNIEGKAQWKKYLRWISNYIANPTIAWDYSNQFKHTSNGTVHFRNFGYKVDYIVKIDKEVNQAYICIMKIDFNLAEFGLEMPPLLNENKRTIQLTESQLRNIIRRTILDALYN